MPKPPTGYRGLWAGEARATDEHLLAANDDGGDLTDEDLAAIDEQFDIRRNLDRAVNDRRERSPQ